MNGDISICPIEVVHVQEGILVQWETSELLNPHHDVVRFALSQNISTLLGSVK